jgi:lipopolysaccharide transport system ATP-binding protein
MSGTAIAVEGLGKRYLLGEDASRHRVADVLFPWRNGGAGEFWALRDVSFKVEEGESLGIIGRNGAGKSTLLKVLSRITAPTEGRATVRGRVGTLLEAGTGFHPELSGRDNIFLSGAILGLRQKDIKARFDEIMDFSEVGKFIDTPVKRYSSGMQVRLAFAVAMYLDPEILIVDEVLSVGDLGFQRKSINRMREATDKEGRTVLFVSHSLEAVRKSCQRVLVLDEGRLTFFGSTEDGIDFYRDAVPMAPEAIKDVGLKGRLARTNGAVRFLKAEIVDGDNQQKWSFRTGETARFRFEYEVTKPIGDLMFTFRLLAPKDELGGTDELIVTNICEVVSREPLPVGYRGGLEIVLPDLKLRPGDLSLHLHLGAVDDRTSFDIVDTTVGLPSLRIKSGPWSERLGLVSLDYQFRTLPIDQDKAAAVGTDWRLETSNQS